MELRLHSSGAPDFRILERPEKRRAWRAVEETRRIVDLLEQAFQLMAEDNVLQPAIKYVYAALCEAETRAAVLEDWYERTYSGRGLPIP